MSKIIKVVISTTALLLMSTVAQAALITRVLEVNFPVEMGSGYGPGHAFDITMTYDDAGNTKHTWSDGPNGIAELGGGDDVLLSTFTNPAVSAITMISDATITISGLSWPYAGPGGESPYDNKTTNYAYVYTRRDVAAGQDEFRLFMAADAISLQIEIGVPYDGIHQGIEFFGLGQSIRTDSATGITGTSYNTVYGTGMLTFRDAEVPEPASFALLGLGLVGLGAIRRKQKSA